MTLLQRLWRRVFTSSPAEPLPAARARVEALLAHHVEREQASTWPGARQGLAELGSIREIMARIAADSRDGRAFLVRLERELRARHARYVPEAEDGSDRGRLGSFLHDLQALRRTPEDREGE